MNLERFISEQKEDYEIALTEIKAGRKRSHWMWYIFPQIHGLGYSAISQRYAIQSAEEAKEYMKNKVLREHLLEISEALITLDTSDATAVMGFPDDLKLRSCMTLFAQITPEYEVFQKVLEKYYGGVKDPKTMEVLQRE